MNKPCEKRRDKLADYVLEILSRDEINALDEHISQCSRCKEYVEALRFEKKQLLQLGEGLDGQMPARKLKVIEALEQVSRKKIRPPSILRIIIHSRITKFAAAAVIIIATSLFFMHEEQTGEIKTQQITQTAKSSAELLTIGYLNLAYRHGGMKAVEEQSLKALGMAAVAKSNIKQLQEEFLKNNGI